MNPKQSQNKLAQLESKRVYVRTRSLLNPKSRYMIQAGEYLYSVDGVLFSFVRPDDGKDYVIKDETYGVVIGVATNLLDCERQARWTVEIIRIYNPIAGTPEFMSMSDDERRAFVENMRLQAIAYISSDESELPEPDVADDDYRIIEPEYTGDGFSRDTVYDSDDAYGAYADDDEIVSDGVLGDDLSTEQLLAVLRNDLAYAEARGLPTSAIKERINDIEALPSLDELKLKVAELLRISVSEIVMSYPAERVEQISFIFECGLSTDAPKISVYFTIHVGWRVSIIGSKDDAAHTLSYQRAIQVDSYHIALFARQMTRAYELIGKLKKLTDGEHRLIYS